MRLDGREFDDGVTQQITAAQNDYLFGHLRIAGILDLLEKANGVTDEAALNAIREEFATRILLSGEKGKIIAGCLTEQGKKWSRVEADRNAVAFDAITDAEEQGHMTRALVTMVWAFFPLGENSLETSPKSSAIQGADQDTASEEQPTLESSLQSSGS